MDAEFLKQLDRDMTDVGRDALWKRDVGGRTVWISPVPWEGQARVNETMTDESLGVNFAYAVKRLTLSYAIVGMDQLDLRPHRESGPVFSVTVRGKTTKVSLQKYIYEKMGSWGDPWIEAAFNVFADLMETHKGENLEKIVFENVQLPLDELVELELKAGKIRDELDMPQMTEVGSEGAKYSTEDAPPPPTPGELPDAPDAPPDGPLELKFDPFAKVEGVEGPIGPGLEEGPIGPGPAPDPSSGANGPAAPAESGGHRRVQEPDPPPVRTVPVPLPSSQELRSPIERAMATHEAGKSVVDVLDAADHRKAKEPSSSPDRPFQAQPSVQNEVLEQPAERKVVEPPRVNQGAASQSKNPRFHKAR